MAGYRDDSAGKYGQWTNDPNQSWGEYLQMLGMDAGEGAYNALANITGSLSPIGTSEQGNMALQVPPMFTGLYDSAKRIGERGGFTRVEEFDAPLKQDLANALLTFYGGNALAGLAKPKATPRPMSYADQWSATPAADRSMLHPGMEAGIRKLMGHGEYSTSPQVRDRAHGLADNIKQYEAEIARDPANAEIYTPLIQDAYRAIQLYADDAATDGILKSRGVSDGAIAMGKRLLSDAGVTKPRGALGAGAMREAEAQPIRAYRGATNAGNIARDDASILWGSSSPDVASTYARPHFTNYDIEGAVAPLDMDFRNPLTVDANGKHWAELEHGGQRYTADDLANLAKSQGHDGLIVKNVMDTKSWYPGEPRTMPADTYVALQRGTVKSPLTGETLFSDNKPSILGAALATAGEQPRVLPMDHASRMARAKEMGFDTDRTLYHGTNKDFESFIPSQDGALGAGAMRDTKGVRPEPNALQPKAEAMGGSDLAERRIKASEDAYVNGFRKDIEENKYKYFNDWRDDPESPIVADEWGNQILGAEISDLYDSASPYGYRGLVAAHPAVAQGLNEAAIAAGRDLYLSPSSNSGSYYGKLKTPAGNEYKVRVADHAQTSSKFDAPDYNIAPGEMTPEEFARLMPTLLSDNKPSLLGAALATAGEQPKVLPMDQASRMARAKEMGFDTDRILNHTTTAAPFDEFKLPEYADGRVHAVYASPNKSWEKFIDTGNGQAHTRELLAKTDKPFLWDGNNMEDTARRIREIYPEWEGGFYGGVNAQGKDAGHTMRMSYGMADALKANGYDSLHAFRSGNALDDEWAFLYPEKLRDVNAAFDPARAGENGLLLSDNKPSILGAALATAGEQPKGITAYHGSPHDFDKFSLDKIGTGEGAQAYGHGLYFADSEDVARSYRDNLSNLTPANVKTPLPGKIVNGKYQYAPWTAEEQAALDAVKTPPGKMYQVRINADPESFLDWDKPLSQQNDKVKALSQNVFSDPKIQEKYFTENDMTGQDFYSILSNASDYGPLPMGVNVLDPAPSNKLREVGIPGVRYLDGGSRSSGSGSYNYSVFDDSLIEILKKYGMAGGAVGAGALAQPDSASAQELPNWLKF